MPGTAYLHLNGTTYQLPNSVADAGPHSGLLRHVAQQVETTSDPKSHQLIDVVIDRHTVTLSVDPARIAVSAVWYVESAPPQPPIIASRSSQLPNIATLGF